MSEIKICEICGSSIHEFSNYCEDWNCHIEIAKRNGGEVFTPNNLPILSIRHDWKMLEHEHGDHPDYIFPVDVEYVGPKDESRYELSDGNGYISTMDESWKYLTDHETHALLYANHSVAVTMYETCSSVWFLQEDIRGPLNARVLVGKAGRCVASHLLNGEEWCISEESLAKIKEYVNKKFG